MNVKLLFSKVKMFVLERKLAFAYVCMFASIVSGLAININFELEGCLAAVAQSAPVVLVVSLFVVPEILKYESPVYSEDDLNIQRKCNEYAVSQGREEPFPNANERRANPKMQADKAWNNLEGDNNEA